MTTGTAVLLLGALALAADGLTAQEEPRQLGPGSRIRVRAQETHIGTLLTLDSTNLVLRRDTWRDTVSVAVGTIRSLQVSRGRKSAAGEGALNGGLTGAMTGVVLGLGLAAATEGCGPGGGYCPHFGPEVILPAAAVLGGAGALLGALIGWAGGTDRWEAVPLGGARLGVVPLRGQGIGVGASIAF